MTEIDEEKLRALAEHHLKTDKGGSMLTEKLARGVLRLLDERDHLLKAEDISTAMLHTHECPPCEHPPPEDLEAALDTWGKPKGTVETQDSYHGLCDAIESHRCPSPASARVMEAAMSLEEWGCVPDSMDDIPLSSGADFRRDYQRLCNAVRASAADAAKDGGGRPMTILMSGDTPNKVMTAYWLGEITEDQAVGYIGRTLFDALEGDP